MTLRWFECKYTSVQHHHQQHDIPYLKSILDDDSLTFAEKAIIVKNVRTKSDRESSKSKITSLAGEIVVVDFDLAMAQDSTGSLAIRSLNEMGIDKTMRSVIMGNPPLAFQTVGDMMFFGKDIALATYAGLAIYFVVASIVGLIFGIVMTSKRLKPRTMSYGICLGIIAGLVAFPVLALPIITIIIPKEIVTCTYAKSEITYRTNY